MSNEEGAARFRGDLSVKVKRGGPRRFNPWLLIRDFLRSVWL